MTIFGTIYDQSTGNPLPGATISKYMGSSAAPVILGISDNAGSFTVNAGSTDDIIVTYVGYTPVRVNAGLIMETGGVNLTPSFQNMVEVVVTAIKKAPWFIWAAIAFVGYSLLSKKR